MKSAVAAVVALWLLFGAAGVHCGIPRLAQAQPSQTWATINADQAHLADGSTSSCPAKFGTAVLPRSGVSMGAFAVLAAFGIVTGCLVLLRAPSGRSPPARLAAPITGQILLTRFCLARR